MSASESKQTTTMWPHDLGVLFRWPELLDVFPSAKKEAAVSYNAISRLVVYGGLVLYSVKREPIILAGTAMMMLYLFNQRDRYKESYYMNIADMMTDDEVAPQRDQQAEALQQETSTAARRMVDNPRDIRSRAAIVPTTDDKIYAARPALNNGNWDDTRSPQTYLDGMVGIYKSVQRPVDK